MVAEEVERAGDVVIWVLFGRDAGEGVGADYAPGGVEVGGGVGEGGAEEG